MRSVSFVGRGIPDAPHDTHPGKTICGASGKPRPTGKRLSAGKNTLPSSRQKVSRIRSAAPVLAAEPSEAGPTRKRTSDGASEGCPTGCPES